VSQHAALAALELRSEADAAIRSMVNAFRERRDAAVAILRGEPRLHFLEPQGAFYIFVDVSAVSAGTESPGSAFARHLLERHQTAVVPGAAFLAPGWIRMSYAAPLDTVVEGTRRIVAAMRQLSD
jgi:aspartate aminotransferase